MAVLPQMKSIWLDEDEEAEKLYGLQAQQFMGPDDEDALSIRMVNSDKPLLSNKKKIDLGPLTKNKFRMPRSPASKGFANGSGRSSNRDGTQKPKSGFFSLFKGKEINNGKNRKISTPFQFQHISHADAKTGFESEDEKDEEPNDHEDDLLHPVCSEGCEQHHGDSKCTAIPEGAVLNSRASSARMSYNGSISTSSSRISRFSTGAAGRIVSTSTMATSIQYDHSRIASLNNLGKNYMKHRHVGSADGNSSDNHDGTLEFLKNYNFPSELDNNVLFNFTPEVKPHKISTPIIEAESCYSQETPSFSGVKNLPARLSRHRSDPNLLGTPQMESKWFDEGTPATRRSLDDVLRYYHEPSEENSPLHLALEVGSPLEAAVDEHSIQVDTPLDFNPISPGTSPLRLA
ncbi:hypothetical protein ZYGR_0I05930 [Zygosaccharomyces rouxii]|uniref:ZYRO0C14102p n=2 Tax=Zygosaccharomyces rouxii TaxID=4956 RepID=C5DU58_ZYGRC|nr:uncharacterized protein ZYRO0C14102g [Zygosaccharomyces rouxii]KAH9201505.1 hypothetical protein LQ764DRAFT_81175 [Zygosaccharomyces rouxii]GAV48296.1 hypothetical protein ZYGR_0I05930 [Zygosaccharomyces rouxii]CAR27319.1 ZYRO0C14102p [Zygosaccharomyces rouxii]